MSEPLQYSPFHATEPSATVAKPRPPSPLDLLAPRPAITTPRDLALPGRLLSSALTYLDRLNPLSATQPSVLEMDDAERDGQVAAFQEYRRAIWEPVNTLRRREWRARYGGEEVAGPLRDVIITPKAARFEGRGYQLKNRAPSASWEAGAAAAPISAEIGGGEKPNRRPLHVVNDRKTG